MATWELNGKKYECPSCREEVTTRMLVRIYGEWDLDQPDITKRDYFKLFTILSGANYQLLLKTTENEVTIWNAIGWFVDKGLNLNDNLPKVLQIGDKIVSVPKNVGELGVGQNILVRHAVAGKTHIEEGIAIAAAIFLQPLYDGAKFDMERAKELEKIILDMPAYLIYPVGFFLLSRAFPVGLNTIKKSHQTRTNQKRSLKRMSLKWLRSGSLNVLTTSG